MYEDHFGLKEVKLDTWQGFGLYMFLFITRLIAIPQELHEAAYVDGANGRQDIWHITLPLLKSTGAMVVLLAAIESLKAFALIYVMTNGGPGHATELLITYIYKQAFNATRFDYAAALTVAQFALLLLLTWIAHRAVGGNAGAIE